MKYIKKFEEENIQILMSDFKKGDFVKFIDEESNNIYEITKISYGDHRKYNKLSPIKNGIIRNWILDTPLKHLTNDEKIEIDIIKYNL